MKNYTYLIIGDQEEKKEAVIASLKKEFLSVADAQKLDYEVLSADKLEADTFKKNLMSMPAVAPRRLILLRLLHKLSDANKELLLGYLKNPSPYIVLVLESSALSRGDSFVKKILPAVTAQEFSSGAKANVFDMTRVLNSRKSDEALKILSGLFSDGVHPLQIMGGLVWFWQKNQSHLATARYEQGLRVLQEADLNIKRSRLTPEYAIEVAVVKLAALI